MGGGVGDVGRASPPKKKKNIFRVIITYNSGILLIFRANIIIMCNVYLPCTGTLDRDLVCEDVIAQVSAWKAKFPNYGWVLAGDELTVRSSRH